MLQFVLLFAGCGESPLPPVDFIERFDGNKYDHTRWQLATPGAMVGSVEVLNDGLIITAPPAKQKRTQIRNSGKFAFDGDFEVAIDFKLITPFPEIEKDYINLELIVHGADGVAHFSRATHKGAGNGVVAYFRPTAKSRNDVWKFLNAPDESGTLSLVRKGKTIDFLFTAHDSTHPVVVASAPFGNGPVKNMSVALSVSSPTTTPFQVRVDNIEAHSHPKRNSPLVFVLGGLVLVCLSCLAVVGRRLFRRST